MLRLKFRGEDRNFSRGSGFFSHTFSIFRRSLNVFLIEIAISRRIQTSIGPPEASFSEKLESIPLGVIHKMMEFMGEGSKIL